MLSNHLILCRPLLFLSSIFPRFRIFSNNLALLVVYVCVCVKSLQYVWLFVTPRTVAHQDPLSVGFSRQDNWGGLPWPSCPRGWTCVSYVSCTGSRVLYQLHHLGSPLLVIPAYEFSLGSLDIRCLEVSCFCLVPPLLHSTTDIIRNQTEPMLNSRHHVCASLHSYIWQYLPCPNKTVFPKEKIILV